MIVHTEGIVLRVSPFSRTSHVVTWLTPDHGRVAALVKGALRPKSQFLGQYDLFYTCDVLFYFRDKTGVHLVKECAPINARAMLRGDWRAALTASALCAFVAGVLPLGDHHHPYLYSLLTTGLDALAAPLPALTVLHWFELIVLDELGLRPQITVCSRCGSDCTDTSEGVVMVPASGGMLCSSCHGSHVKSATALPIRPDTLRILRHWQSSSNPHDAARVVCTRRQIADIGSALAAFLRYHIESPSVSKAIGIAGRLHVAEA